MERHEKKSDSDPVALVLGHVGDDLHRLLLLCVCVWGVWINVGRVCARLYISRDSVIIC